jgi:hypothetical protein
MPACRFLSETKLQAQLPLAKHSIWFFLKKATFHAHATVRGLRSQIRRFGASCSHSTSDTTRGRLSRDASRHAAPIQDAQAPLIWRPHSTHPLQVVAGGSLFAGAQAGECLHRADVVPYDHGRHSAHANAATAVLDQANCATRPRSRLISHGCLSSRRSSTGHTAWATRSTCSVSCP